MPTILNRDITLPPSNPNIANRYLDNGFHEVLASIFSSRNIEYDEDVFYPKMNKIFLNSDKYFLPDSKDFIQYLHQAVQNNTKIVIFGDYDVDGLSSLCILNNLLSSINANFNVQIPIRSEGYGLNIDKIKEIKENFECQFLIMMDCGTSMSKEIDFARSIGIKTAVIDHHLLPQEPANPDFFINPHRIQDDSNNFYSMCAGLLTFFVARCYYIEYKIPISYDDLFFAMISTVCDISPMTPINRALLRHAMHMIRTGKCRPQFLIAISQFYSWDLRNISYSDVGFTIGPLINASSRVGDINTCFQAMISHSLRDALSLVNTLHEYNEQRKNYEYDAMKIAENAIDYQSDVFIGKSDQFHHGIIGLVASRISEMLGKTAIVCTVSNNNAEQSMSNTTDILNASPHTLTCSIRSPYDCLGDFIAYAHQEGFIDKGGGHSKAAGISLANNKFNNMVHYAKKYFLDYSYPLSHVIDYVATDIEFIDSKFLQQYLLHEPFGSNFTPPIFLIQNCIIMNIKKFRRRGMEIILQDRKKNTIKCMNFSFNNLQYIQIEKAYSQQSIIGIIGLLSVQNNIAKYHIIIKDIVI